MFWRPYTYFYTHHHKKRSLAWRFRFLSRLLSYSQVTLTLFSYRRNRFDYFLFFSDRHISRTRRFLWSVLFEKKVSEKWKYIIEGFGRLISAMCCAIYFFWPKLEQRAPKSPKCAGILSRCRAGHSEMIRPAAWPSFRARKRRQNPKWTVLSKNPFACHKKGCDEYRMQTPRTKFHHSSTRLDTKVQHLKKLAEVNGSWMEPIAVLWAWCIFLGRNSEIFHGGQTCWYVWYSSGPPIIRNWKSSSVWVSHLMQRPIIVYRTQCVYESGGRLLLRHNIDVFRFWKSRSHFFSTSFLASGCHCILIYTLRCI